MLIMATEGTVAAKSSPTVRKRQLGMELRRLREAAGKSQQEAGAEIDVTGAAISLMESAQRGVVLSNVRVLCQFYGVEATLTAYLENLVRESRTRGWWVTYGDTVPRWFADYLGMETAATEVWTYEPELFPGLLQGESYANVVAPTRGIDAQRFTRLRLERQRRLIDDDPPLILRVVFSEAVVHRVVGSPLVMCEQIRHVINLAMLPNVTIQILLFSTGSHPGMTGPYAALRFADTPLMDTVYIELDGGAVYLEKPPEVERYAENFERLSEIALDAEETISYLEEFMERRYSNNE